MTAPFKLETSTVAKSNRNDPLEQTTPARPTDANLDLTDTSFKFQFPHRSTFPPSMRIKLPECEPHVPAEISSDFVAVASTTIRATDVLDKVAIKLDADERDPELTPIGRERRAMPTIDEARVTINKLVPRVTSGREIAAALMRPARSRTSDLAHGARLQWTFDRYAGIVDEIARLRLAHRAADRLIKGVGDGDDAELVRALLDAPRWMVAPLFPDFSIVLPILQQASNPEKHLQAEWMTWACDKAEYTIRVCGEWLDARRARFGHNPKSESGRASRP